MKLLVAIHDVTPALAVECRRLWGFCAARGVSPALFVVPNWHGQWPLQSHRSFVEWLQDCMIEGAEVFLHGERHDEFGTIRGWRDHLRAVGRTDHEGEFLTLDERAARERMERGIGLLRDLALDPVGFVAPAWLARESTYTAVGACGLRVSEDSDSVRLHRRGMKIHSPVLRWSARTPTRARMSIALASLRWQWQHDTPLMRIALHPSDLHSGVTARSLKHELARWTDARTVWRYTQL